MALAIFKVKPMVARVILGGGCQTTLKIEIKKKLNGNYYFYVFKPLMSNASIVIFLSKVIYKIKWRKFFKRLLEFL